MGRLLRRSPTKVPYYFVNSEPVSDALRRVAAEELSLTISLLENRSLVGRDERVHEARKGLKRLRALVHLGRSALSPATLERENAAFRDCARLLSRMRSADASLECFGELVSGTNTGLAPIDVATIRRRLEDICTIHHNQAAEPFEEAIGLLEAALSRVTDWSFHRLEWAALGAGLEAIYAKGRKAMGRALAAESPEAFHAWRKQVKYLWYSIRLIEPCWPKPLRGLASELDVLGETLGHEHDLVDLEGIVVEQCPAAESDLIAAVLTLARVRRAALRDTAVRSGRCVYVEPPKAFRRRILSYLDPWAKEPQRGVRVDG